MSDTDVAIVGGGIVGLSVACGLVSKGQHVTVFDGRDADFRASRGNFGLVWVQGKGDGLLEYARWSQQSAALWPAFAKELQDQTGIELQLKQPGGMYLCLNDEELDQRVSMLDKMRNGLGGDYPFERLSNAELKSRMPGVGDEVAGATYCPLDGHVNPLNLLRALHEVFRKRGGKLVNGIEIQTIQSAEGGFTLQSEASQWQAGKVVLAAGLGNRRLASQLGLHAPVTPNRGQVLVSERVAPMIHYPTGHIRQTGDGTIQLGDSKEDVGFNDGTTVEEMNAIAARAVKMFPALGKLRLVRAWGALRVMTADGYPVYQESSSCPGAFVVTCHSGVTLAANHAGPLADWIDGKKISNKLDVFSGDRFHV